MTRLRMARFNQKQLKWLRTLSTDDAWTQIVKDGTAGTRVDPEMFLQKLSPLPNLKKLPEVRRWLGWVLAKIDNMSAEEAKVLHACCDVLTALFKVSRK